MIVLRGDEKTKRRRIQIRDPKEEKRQKSQLSFHDVGERKRKRRQPFSAGGKNQFTGF